MTMRTNQLNYFWHDTDTYTLTSYNIPWIYPGKKLMKTGVCVLPELFMELNLKDVTLQHHQSQSHKLVQPKQE